MLGEFREFAVKGNVVDMAVGIVIGGAFGTIVKSLVDDIIMPPVGMLLGGVDFSNIMTVLKGDGPYASPQAAQEAGAVTINWGLFVNSLISFLIVAWALFLVIKAINRLKAQFEEKKEEEAPAAPPEEVALLTEIRDLLAKK
ncbi:large conductance mechanosensitive channel protein MscL [Microbaculum marinisediminis]|uniref:Large-conductance mechanosensitive channel n=1 Tax=Microbaculum marinisediminis TaxID=2931392 RepID=A0AAW5QVG5_9HYPH|nr:large conductance mechanosensitive channel protein MscL [Microbaculum sp. A6E488]MCT8970658.1 large conductance mechanosensitive channel protein MscL [Microbaculum sp. A6E488]